MLIDHDLELALELGQFVVVGYHTIRREGRHILNDHQAELVTGVIEQVWFDFDLKNKKPLVNAAYE